MFQAITYALTDFVRVDIDPKYRKRAFIINGGAKGLDGVTFVGVLIIGALGAGGVIVMSPAAGWALVGIGGGLAVFTGGTAVLIVVKQFTPLKKVSIPPEVFRLLKP